MLYDAASQPLRTPVLDPSTTSRPSCIGSVVAIAISSAANPSIPATIASPSTRCNAPLTFSFGGIAMVPPRILHPGDHTIAQNPVHYPLMFSFAGNVERVRGIAPNPSIEVSVTLPGTKYNAPSQLIGIVTPGASTAVR
ncbi:hypothetical protein B0H16DRAFT_1734406 [Mycena metata]|uniref:Uncharacterized protein n=1 Tax=Mycena metata TaxID=1033252 RepID=A0AAD7MR58_9AGAR|nr:hypothetical protein B0H16DRAFT_1734406 [Mycena metata]